jgi:hypothetical protein
MSEITLDRSRAFGTIFGGVPEDGAMFVQDGNRYKPDGSLVGAKETPVAVELTIEEPAVKPAKVKKVRSAVEPTDENHDLL